MTPADELAAAIARRINTHKHRCPEAANTEPEPWMTAAANDIAAAISTPGFYARLNPDQMRRAIIAELEQDTP